MLKDTMSHAQLSIFTEVATIILVAVFLGALLYLFVWRAKASWKTVSELPLQDDLARPSLSSNTTDTDTARTGAGAFTNGSMR